MATMHLKQDEHKIKPWQGMSQQSEQEGESHAVEEEEVRNHQIGRRGSMQVSYMVLLSLLTRSFLCFSILFLTQAIFVQLSPTRPVAVASPTARANTLPQIGTAEGDSHCALPEDDIRAAFHALDANKDGFLPPYVFF